MIYHGKQLYHYGTKGQKWGVRNYQNEDGSYTAEGQSQNGGHGRYATECDDSKSPKQIDKSSKKGLTDKQKKYIKIGLAVAATALVAYGGYKLYKNNEFSLKAYKNLGKKNIDFIRNSETFDYLDVKSEGLAGITDQTVKDISDNFGVTLKNTNMSIKEDIDFLYNNRNPGDESDCGPLAFDFFLRRAGFDVTTADLGIERRGGLSINELGAYAKGLNKNPIDTTGCSSSSDYISKIKQAIKEQCGNDINKECVGFIDLLPSTGTGHFTSWYTEGGEIFFTDIQSKGADITNKINYSALSNIIVSRLDNCEIKGRNLLGSKTDFSIKAILKNL